VRAGARAEEADSVSPLALLEAIERLAEGRRGAGALADEAGLAREVAALVAEAHPADVAYVLEGLPLEDRRWVWGLVRSDHDGEILLEVSDAVRDTLLEDMDSAEMVAAAQSLDADEIADLAPDLPREVVQDIIEAQEPGDRADLQ
jgi:magnesium transporter